MAETRITGGEWRGRVVTTPRGLPLRPTRSLVREALFNILGSEVVDAEIVDLYAGAGTLGFEALSRGAASVVFVDRTREALRLIAATADRFGCGDRVELVVADAVGWLRGRGARTMRDCTLCFMDAPYQDDGAEAALNLLGVAPPPLVVCEHHQKRTLPDRAGQLERVRVARYGLTSLSFYRVPEAQDVPEDGTAAAAEESER